MNKTKRAEIFQRLRELNPQPRTELEYANPFQLLVAVVLSAQATDVGVNKATRRLFAAAPTPETMLALGVDGPHLVHLARGLAPPGAALLSHGAGHVVDLLVGFEGHLGSLGARV